MPTALTIKAVNLNEWKRLAAAAGKALNAPDTIRDVETTLTRRFQRYSREMFESEGGFGAGGQWVPLSPAYAERKALQYPGKTILRRTDRMFRSFVTRRENIAFGARAGQGFVFKYGSTVPYSIFHALGTPFMVARKVLNPTAQQLRGIAAAIGRTIIHGVFSRKFFDSIDTTGLFPGFRLTGQAGFDSVDIP